MSVRLLVLLLFTFRCASTILAQLPSIELHTVHPPVFRAGTASGISLHGAHLEELTGLHFSTPSIGAEPILRPATEFHPDPPQDGTRFTVQVAPDHPGGWVEVRAAGLFGISTSRPALVVPADAEIVSDGAGSGHHEKSSAPVLPREAFAHGTTDANRIDWWKFEMKKGERILAHCFAERIDSRADATLTVADGSGRQLESSRDFIGRDPMIDFTAPADGTYWIGVHDFLFLGGENFPYLLHLSQRPWIDAVDPPVGQQGQILEATLSGRLLPGSTTGKGAANDGKPIETLSVKIPVPDSAAPSSPWDPPARGLLPTFSYSIGNSLPVAIGITSHPVTRVAEAEEPVSVTPGKEIASTIAEDGDTDRFRFTAGKGTHYFVEVIGNRINGQFDPYLLVEKITKGENGAETRSTIRESDDINGFGGATFPDRSLDPVTNFIADEDGDYEVTVLNQFGRGSATMTYRLVIREADPDFSVVAVSEREFIEQRQAFPAAPLLRQGGTFPMRLLIYRQDSFPGPITIEAGNLPAGVTCPPVTARNKENVVHLVFSASPDAAEWSGLIELTASATIGEKEVRQPVRNGTLVAGSGDYNTSRLRSRLETAVPLSVSSSEKTPVRIDAPGERKFSVTMGEKLEIPVQVTNRNAVKGNLTVTPVGMRGLIKPPNITIADKASEGKLTLNFTKQNNVFHPEPGTWNLVFKGSGVTPYAKNPAAVTRAKEQQKHIDALAAQAVEKTNAAKKTVEDARNAVTAAEKNLAAASPEAKPQQEKALAGAKTALESAEAALAAAETRKSTAEKEKAAIAKRVGDLTKLAAKKDLKFASWSLPVTIEVKEAPPEPEKP